MQKLTPIDFSLSHYKSTSSSEQYSPQPVKRMKALFHYVLIKKPFSNTLKWNKSSQSRHSINFKLGFSHQVTKLIPALLNLSDPQLLLTKLENQLVSHPLLALPQWEGEDLWYMYMFMKLQSFMLSGTLYIVLHILLVDKSLQFNLYRTHNIPLLHPVLKKLFKYSIQEEYLAIRSDSHYISFPLSVNIMACQASNGQFCHINSPLYAADTSKSCSYALFQKKKVKINNFVYYLCVMAQSLLA